MLRLMQQLICSPAMLKFLMSAPRLSGARRVVLFGALNRRIANQRSVFRHDAEAFVLKVLGERPRCKVVHRKASA